MITVGHHGTGYVEDRSLPTVPNPDIRFVRTYDAYNVPNFLQRRLFGNSQAISFFNCIHQDFGLNRVDVFHFVNTISAASTPWICTFEHYLPRWNPSSQYGMKLLARPSCKHLLAMSGFARNSQLELLKEHPALADRILPKITVLHPPQALLVGSYDEKPVWSRPITCTFVGRDFFRKGGLETLGAVASLIQEGHDITLHVVSGLEFGDYATKSTENDLAEARRLLDTMGHHAHMHEEMPNSEVLALLRASHVGLLPTYDDTYGFSVLESQAAGTPVITTNVDALPEINNDEVGWVIPLLKDRYGQAVRKSTENRETISTAIREGVYAALKEALGQPGIIREKGIRALDRVARFHDPGAHAQRLFLLYAAASGVAEEKRRV
jgi:glycosyltransferase involved in cell wall biosynthesis